MFVRNSGSKRNVNKSLVDKFIKNNLPPKILWPDLVGIDNLSYEKRLNCASELLDKAITEGLGEKVAIYGSTGGVTYQELLSQANQIAHVLSDDAGILPGSRVLIRSSNNIMMVACWFAVVKIGAVAILSMPMQRTKELTDMVSSAQIQLALCEERYVEELYSVQETTAVLEKIITFSGEKQLEQLMGRKPTEFKNYQTFRDDVCQISFSMGDSGIPKATLHFHQDLLAVSDTYAKHVLKMSADDVVIGTPSLALAYGLGALLIFPMRFRASTVLLEQGTMEALLMAVHTYKATVMFNVPTAYRFMLEHVKEHDLSSLRICVSAGEHLSSEVWHAWHNETGIKLMDGIGTTELTHIFISSRIDDIRPGSTGKPVPGYEAKVVDENGNDISEGMIGRLAVRGPTGCLYLKGDNQSQYVKDGWNLTGDLFSVDKEGYFWFQGRCDDLIITSGYNIAGPEIEATLLTHKAVEDCCVVGVPHPERGIVVKAFIVAADDVVDDSDTLAKALQTWIKMQLAPYKYPRLIEFVESLPRHATGVLDRAKLRKASEGGLDKDLSRIVADGQFLSNLKAMTSKGRKAVIEAFLIRSLKEVLSSEPALEIDSCSSFYELGLDSVALINLKKLYEQTFEIKLPSTVMFDYPAVDDLSEYLFDKILPPEERDVSSNTAGDIRDKVPDNSSEENIPDRFAIIGLACRMPGGVKNHDQFWALLCSGRDVLQEVPAARWDMDTYFDSEKGTPGKSYCRYGYFIDDVDLFDAGFFRLTPREANLMDPQQRLLLESSWEALESAGLNPTILKGTATGVFIGMMNQDYRSLLSAYESEDLYKITGTMIHAASGRIAYCLGLQGPAITIDTGCSSSGVAIHLACQSLKSGESDLAIAGGVNLHLSPESMVDDCAAGMLANDGRSKTFDARADGFGRGEGCGVIVLKRYQDAIKDNDPIIAVVRGSSVNHNGASGGLSVPYGSAQEALINQAIKNARVDSKDISLVEIHGTGTALGDPIEINALKNVFFKQGVAHEFICLGALKTNIGHLEAASCIASVIKVALCLKHQKIPANLHFETLNPNISFENGQFIIPTQLQEWPSPDKTRLAGVSSFGLGGTNAHIILEEPPSAVSLDTEFNAPCIIVLSAKSKNVLVQYAQDLKNFAESLSEKGISLYDLAYTLQVARDAMQERLALVVSSVEQLKEKLTQFIAGEIQVASCFSHRVYAGEEVDKVIINGISGEGDLDRIAQSWLKGGNVDWSLLYNKHQPRRIAAPTYPFDRKRYWVANPSLSLLNDASCGKNGQRHIVGTVLFAPSWQLHMDGGAQEFRYDARRLIIVCDPESLLQEKDISALEKGIGNTQCLRLAASVNEAGLLDSLIGVMKNYEYFAEAILNNLKKVLREKLSESVFFQVVFVSKSACPPSMYEGLSGLLKTARLENPKLRTQFLSLYGKHGEGFSAELDNFLQLGCRHPMLPLLRSDEGGFSFHRWLELFVVQNQEQQQTGFSGDFPWKDSGVYLITGGVGGLAYIFAEEIARRTRSSRLILTGRTKLSEERRVLLKKLEDNGVQVEYRESDLSSARSVEQLVQWIIERFGRIDGLLHGAGVTRDNYLINKSAQELDLVFAPKVEGVIHLDRVTRHLDLDFFVLFSSINATLGNPGQADYAAANAFLDGFSEYRHQLVLKGERKGHTLSINWPYWCDGGMKIDAATQSELQYRLGLLPMASDVGIKAFYQAYCSGRHQVGILFGKVDKLKENWFTAFENDKENTDFASTTSGSVSPSDAKGNDVILVSTSTVANLLRAIFAETVQAEIADIDAEEPLENYGIDSIIITQLNHKLALIFGDLSKTLLFEHQTLSELAGYFTKEYPEKCLQWIKNTMPVSALSSYSAGIPQSDAETRQITCSNSTLPSAQMEMRELAGLDHQCSASTVKQIHKQHADSQQSIAIIGLHGQYPDADTLAEFWENLKGGKDSITEIPQERWTLEGFFDPDPKMSSKGMSYGKWGGFLDGFSEFDPLFFNISPREAVNMDPQERLFVKSCWAVLEDAGYTRETLRTKYGSQVAIYVGVTKTGFELYGPDIRRQGEAFYPRTSFSSIANRVSYLFDLHGPSVAIDTMCSSSLTAIHEACEYLRRNPDAMAIAGGVNLYTHPANYVELSIRNMLSPNGRCHSFGNEADGFVPGEGVGSMLLKPLVRAELDNDHIYGVIRGSAINHGGKTNGYMVPSPVGQGNLIVNALDNANIDARAVSYVEAHGTGTKLGDPIEITGLTKAFRKSTQDTEFCSIGSVKSNIGHLEAAAGIAGITKILLQMKHQTLVPSLHAGTLNPNINFTESPFYVQKESKPWKRPIVEIDGRHCELPLVAAVSSFGAGGANAIALIEEYVNSSAQNRIVIDIHNPAAVLLSAKSAEQLNRQAQQLLQILRDQPFTSEDLADIAYTLQVGREAMDVRLGMLVVSIEDLIAKLEGVVAGKNESGEVFTAKIDEHLDIIAIFKSNSELMQAVQSWTQPDKLGNLVELWVKGLAFDWSLFYTNPVCDNEATAHLTPKRISLPTYPFLKNQYWLPHTYQSTKGMTVNQLEVGTLGHPLLQKNTSSFIQQRFTSTFTGHEFFLRDHIVRKRRILPGCAYLEMAREAVIQALDADSARTVFLKEIRWITPIAFESENYADIKQNIHIQLIPEDKGEISFEIYSESVVPNFSREKQFTVHCQGKAFTELVQETPELDLTMLNEVCCQHELGSQAFYKAFNAIGINYGESHQGVEFVRLGVDASGSQNILSRIKLPSGISGTEFQFVLHPSLMDAAFQSTLTLALGFEPGACSSVAEDLLRVLSQEQTVLPFVLDSIEIIKACPSNLWVWGRYSADNRTQGRLSKIDLDLCDDEGRVCVLIRGLSSRVFVAPAVSPQSETILFSPEWITQKTTELVDASVNKHVLVICDPSGMVSENDKQILAEEITDIEIITMAVRSADRGIQDIFPAYTESLIEQLKCLLLNKNNHHTTLQVVLIEEQGNTAGHQLCAGLSGVINTIRREDSKLHAQLIELCCVTGASLRGQLLSALKHGLTSPEVWIRSIDGELKSLTWREISVAGDDLTHPDTLPWKNDGVYLIAGGAGGIGMLMAGEIADKVVGAIIILSGRKPPEKGLLAQLKLLEKGDSKIVYLQADISDPDAVSRLIERILAEYGTLDGVINSAGVIHDNYIFNKTPDEIHRVLLPKVSGTVNLDQSTKHLPLDFFILFSSASAVLGNAGQTDYAAANAFLDQFAYYRNALQTSGKRHGKTLSINWPLWKHGGMQVDEHTEEMLRKSLGVTPMPTPQGIAALYFAYSSNYIQLMVIDGERAKLREQLGCRFTVSIPKAETHTPISSAPVQLTKIDGGIGFSSDKTVKQLTSENSNDTLLEQFKDSLIQLVAAVLMISPEDVDGDTDLNEYGFDSITFTELSNKINDHYSTDIAPTLFFEYASLSGLSAHLLEEYPLIAAAFAPAQAEKIAAPVSPVIERRTDVLRYRQLSSPSLAHAVESISSIAPTPRVDQPSSTRLAIIGMSGCFPKSRDLQEFWNNLQNGVDCISEIPFDRWDWQSLYGDPEEDKNRTKVKWGGFIDGVAEFDPLFFGISPKEAQLMDPQQRLMMMHIWNAIEDAGYSADSFSDTRTAIFVGAGVTGYSNLISSAGVPVQGYTATGMAPSIGPNRMSYFLNTHGPSEPVETACSSSLIAIHKAMLAIENDHCDMAIVGGVNIIVNPEIHISFDKAGMLAKDGRCKTFSSQANGYARGEGVGMIVLKRLEDAEKSGDQIYAVICASAENHGGRANSLTAPNPLAQSELIQEAYRRAGIDPRTVGYIEAHGTGTELGDPIEINGLKDAFKMLYRDTQTSTCIDVDNAHCGLGSVKSNIGHLEVAAGIAGVIKTVLQIKHKTLVKSLHADVVNPYIDLKGSPFYIVRDCQPWERPRDDQGNDLPRRAGVSSFGFGGVNAHVVIEEYVPPGCSIDNEPAEIDLQARPALLILSARTPKQLTAQAIQLRDFLQLLISQSNGDEAAILLNLTYTLQVGRQAMDERLGLITHSLEDAVSTLNAYLCGDQSVERLYIGRVKEHREMLKLLAKDDEMEFVLRGWIDRGKFSKVLQLWVKGMSFNWEQLYVNCQPARVSLPTYPFDCGRYWYTQLPFDQVHRNFIGAGLIGDSDSSGNAQEPDLHEIYWQWQACSEPESGQKIVGSKLVFTDLSVVELDELSNVFALDTVLTLPENTANSLDGDILIGHYLSLIERVKSEIKNGQLTGIVFIVRHETHLTAMLQGACRSICKEFQNSLNIIWLCKGLIPNKALASQLVGEYRGGHVGVREIRFSQENNAGLVKEERRAVSKDVTTFAGIRRIQHNQVYLITGGNGGIGRLVALHMAKQYQATVILTGRSYLDIHTDEYFKDTAGNAYDIHYIQADCSDESDMSRVVEYVRTRYGEIYGVIHSAGVLSDGPLMSQTAEKTNAVMAPKVKGLLTLDAVTRNERLGQFILFSSISSVLGNAGQADYAAANAFLNAFSKTRNELVANGDRFGETKVIHWPYWREGGMTVSDSQLRYLFAETGMKVLPTNLGLKIFDRFINDTYTERTIFYGDETRLLHHEQIKGSNERNVNSGQVVERSGVIDIVRETLCSLTNIDIVELNNVTHLTDYGVDSLLFQNLSHQLNQVFCLDVSVSQYREHQTVAELADFLLLQVTENRSAGIMGNIAAGKKSKEKSSHFVPSQGTLESDGRDAALSETCMDDLAIIGINGAFPQCNGIEEFWDRLMSGDSVVSEYPEKRWNLLPKEFTQAKDRKNYIGCFLENILGFDHRLFKVSPREAMLMDPQHRLLLQSVWQCIENSGYTTAEFSKNVTAVFTAVSQVDYASILNYDPKVDEFTSLGVSRSICANRISHFFNLPGISEPVDTACSSFFVGVNKAVELLRAGKCDQAIVGAVQVNLLPSGFDALRELGYLAENRTLPFDQNSDGFVRGEGVGCVILKLLSKARSDGDYIHAVIKNAAVWHSGKSIGLTGPNAKAHAEAMKRAFDRPGFDINRLSYIEAHGTGMSQGDATEISAFTQVFRDLGRSHETPCVISGIKSVVGHLETASGIAAMMKAVLALKNGVVPGVAGLKNVHSEIQLDNNLFTLGDSNEPLHQFSSKYELPRNVSLNSYGYGGVSSHILMEEYRNEPLCSGNNGPVSPQLFVLSAMSNNVLQKYLKKLSFFLQLNADANNKSELFDALISAYQQHRDPMRCRLAIIVEDYEELSQKIAEIIATGRETVDKFFHSDAKNQKAKDKPNVEQLDKLIQEERWEQVAEAWVAGADIVWPKRNIGRFPFPEYPMDMDREFWISTATDNSVNNSQGGKQQRESVSDSGDIIISA